MKPRSGNPDRRKSNSAATKIEPHDDDITALRSLDWGERHIDPDIARDWD